MITKQQYTNGIKKELKKRNGSIQPTDLDNLLTSMWRNPSGGLRLTEFGFKVLTEMLGLQSWYLRWDKDDDTKFNQKMLLLDNHLDCPYYIDPKNKNINVTVFSSKHVTMIALQGLKNFLLTQQHFKDT